MTRQSLEDEQVWQDELAALAYTCSHAQCDQEAAVLHAAHSLLERAPLAWRGHFADGPSLTALDLLVAAGGAAAAALALIEGRCGYLLSHGPKGNHIATVAIEGMADEATAAADSAALALIGALAACLSGPVRDIEGGHVTGMSSPSLRLN